MVWLQEFRSSESFVVATVSTAIFTIIPIMPTALIDRMGASEQDGTKCSQLFRDPPAKTSSVQLWVSILLAVYGGSILFGSPFFGYFADHCKLRQVPFVVGLVALAASTGLFALARSFPVLIIARTLQGISAAAVWIVGLSIIVDNVPSERVGEAMGYTTVALSWGSLLGPALGGIMYDKVGFYGAFIVPICLLVADLIMRFAMIETKKSTEVNDSLCNESCSSFASGSESATESFPYLSPDEQSPLLGLSKSEVKNGQKGETKASVTVFNLLRSQRLPLALATIVMISIVISSLDATLPLFVIEKFHWSPSGAGLIFVVPAIASFSTIYIAEHASKIGSRIIGAVAFMLVAMSWFLMQLVKHNTTNDKVLLVGILAVLGASISTIQMIAMTEVSYAVEEHEAEFPGAFGDTLPIAQAYALFNMGLAGGQLLGPVIAGTIRVHAGWSALMVTLGRPIKSTETQTEEGA
ncbi:hypothetical protein N7517_008253 [Penicillium concentricum]|uniref:Major facilitator superfamily (MFS) profile domain-containing protein n=1 Tax=Penicillium concentricum TaxID=293559 RepID=A0A9W9V1H2_9EURO|nr:uncharacterized protein N7517_008253 [Penicillium concentricum]KAJ5365367.1 hypothetical protein N7517_008253 [Penicillium concentricum]